MAGNTKLRGFSPGGIVEFERWGVRAQMKVPPEVRNELSRICSDVLPRKPPERTGVLHPDDFAASYDESMGRVRLDLSPLMARMVAGLLRYASAGNSEESRKTASECAKELEDAYQAHVDYLDTHGEPGIER